MIYSHVASAAEALEQSPDCLCVLEKYDILEAKVQAEYRAFGALFKEFDVPQRMAPERRRGSSQTAGIMPRLAGVFDADAESLPFSSYCRYVLQRDQQLKLALATGNPKRGSPAKKRRGRRKAEPSSDIRAAFQDPPVDSPELERLRAGNSVLANYIRRGWQRIRRSYDQHNVGTDQFLNWEELESFLADPAGGAESPPQGPDVAVSQLLEQRDNDVKRITQSLDRFSAPRRALAVPFLSSLVLRQFGKSMTTLPSDVVSVWLQELDKQCAVVFEHTSSHLAGLTDKRIIEALGEPESLAKSLAKSEEQVLQEPPTSIQRPTSDSDSAKPLRIPSLPATCALFVAGCESAQRKASGPLVSRLPSSYDASRELSAQKECYDLMCAYLSQGGRMEEVWPRFVGIYREVRSVLLNLTSLFGLEGPAELCNFLQSCWSERGGEALSRYVEGNMEALTDPVLESFRKLSEAALCFGSRLIVENRLELSSCDGSPVLRSAAHLLADQFLSANEKELIRKTLKGDGNASSDPLACKAKDPSALSYTCIVPAVGTPSVLYASSVWALTERGG